MGVLLHALHAHLPLPADFRWPQVRPMSASHRGTPRPVYPAGLPGLGDESTWPAYSGHPNDPRAPDSPEHAGTAAALDDVIDALTAARNEVERDDEWTPRVAELVREAIETLQAMEVEP